MVGERKEGEQLSTEVALVSVDHVRDLPPGAYVICDGLNGARKLGVIARWEDGQAYVCGLRPGGWTRPAPTRILAAACESDLSSIGNRAPAPRGIKALVADHPTSANRGRVITVTDLKRERGWTDALIRDHLGAADAEWTNPHYRSGPPMRLYRVGRVEDAEATDGWREARARSAMRREAAQRATATKREATLRRVRRSIEVRPPSVPRMSREELERLAYQHWHARMRERRGYDGEGPGPEHADRLAVNFLRHECTDYEYRLAATYGLVGKEEALGLIRDAVYDAIATAYPDLRDECLRQIDTRVLGNVHRL